MLLKRISNHVYLSRGMDNSDGRWIRTNFLTGLGLIAYTILMNFDLARKAFPVQSRPNESICKLGRAAAFDFNECSLFDNISHLFLLLLSFIGLFL